MEMLAAMAVLAGAEPAAAGREKEGLQGVEVREAEAAERVKGVVAARAVEERVLTQDRKVREVTGEAPTAAPTETETVL